MRKPPSPTLILAYPVSGGLGLFAVAVTGMIALKRMSIDRFDVAPIAFWREPWRLFLSIFPHVGFFHLIFNVYWLWVLGSVLEEVFGHAKTAALIVLFAVVSMTAEFALFSGGVGLSGVNYGLVGLLWVLSKRDRRFVDAMDQRTLNLMVAWFFVCIALTVAKVQPVANVAHGVGALLGVLVGVVLVEKRAAFRALAGLGLVATVAGSAAGATRLRPRINLSPAAASQIAQEGNDAIEAGRLDEAIARYHQAIAMSPRDARFWFNLGIAQARAGHAEESRKAFEKAFEIEPTNPKYREAARSVDDPSSP
ncbi:MAG: rhomboid family intramembrane serine protease [Byssovorax sp.]